MAHRSLRTQGISNRESKLDVSSEDDTDDSLRDLPLSNAKSLSNLLTGELSSSDDETDNQVDGVTEAKDKPEASNDKVTTQVKTSNGEDVKSFPESTGKDFT